MSKLEMKRIAKKAINEQCYCQVLQKNIVLLEASENMFTEVLLGGNDATV